MREKRIYYDDCYKSNFSSIILDKYSEGNKICLLLNNTAFYPNSGGQPCDTGTINDIPVIEVFEREDGEVIHIIACDGNFLKGMEVTCEIDWPRRFDHIQQHTGQHILSQAFLRECSLNTVSFHLGHDFSTIDIDTKDISFDKIQMAEKLANDIVFENRPINIFYETDIEGKVRKIIDTKDIFRLVEIDNFDTSACGGTHARHTGEVGLIAVKNYEKIKDKVRVEFCCGFRALKLFREYDRVFKELSCRFSVGLHDIVARMDNLLNDNKDNIKKLRSMKEKYLEQEIEVIYNSGEIVKDFKYIRNIYSNMTLDDLKFLAKKIISNYDSTVVFLANSSEPSGVVAGRTKNIDLNISGIMKELNKVFFGRGGGPPDFYQGGGYKPEELEDLLLEFKKRL